MRSRGKPHKLLWELCLKFLAFSEMLLKEQLPHIHPAFCSRAYTIDAVIPPYTLYTTTWYIKTDAFWIVETPCPQRDHLHTSTQIQQIF